MGKVGRPAKVIKIGEEFDFLTVIEEAGINLHGDRLYKCRCVCGKVIIRRASHLYYNLNRMCSNSCGCMRKKLFYKNA